MAHSCASRIPEHQYPDFKAFLTAAGARGIPAAAGADSPYAALQPAFRWRPEGADAERFVSFPELEARATGLGSFFLAAGLSRGDRIAILGENRPEWCVSYLGIVAAGFVAVPLDASLDEAGLVRNLEAAHVRALCISSKLARRYPALTEKGGIILDFDLPAGAVEEGRRSWLEATATPASPALPRPGELGPDQPAVVFFTSGTTGIAKGIELSHGAVIENVLASRAALYVDERDVFVALLPLHHTYATTCSFLSAVEAGCTVVVVDRIAPSAVLRSIREGGVTFVIGVPLLFDKIRSGIEAELARLPAPLCGAIRAALAVSRFSTLRLKVPLGRPLFRAIREKAGLGTVRLAVSGGGPLAPATADFFDALGINLVQGYGMSENGPLISVNLPGRKDNRSVGFPVRKTEVRIAEPDLDGIGEIQVRSPSLMRGYLDAPEATRAAMTEDGWLRTGDLGRIDRRGYLFITGRRKSLIVTEGGKNVYPEEIESRFEGSPWIKEVLVVGRPSRAGRPGEEVVAVLVPDYEKIALAHPGREGEAEFVASLLRDEVFRINKSLPPYMKMVDFLVRAEEFEKTSTRKIKRFLYKEYAYKDARDRR